MNLYLAFLEEIFAIFIVSIPPLFYITNNKIYKRMVCDQLHSSRYAVGERFVCFEKNFENSKTFS